MNIVYFEKPIDDANSRPIKRTINKIMAITIRGTETLFQETPLTTRYEPENAPQRTVTIPKAYPTSPLFAATARRAPNSPSETETPQRPGFPRPSIFIPSENQLASLAKLVAIPAFKLVTPIIRTNRSKGLSKAKTFNSPISNPPVIACIPIHKFEDAMPRAARLPDFRCVASTCIRTVETRIITATPSCPYNEPAVDPTARRTRVD